jgi:hypothetical protein
VKTELGTLKFASKTRRGYRCHFGFRGNAQHHVSRKNASIARLHLHQKVTADQPVATRRSRRVNALETAVKRQRVQLTVGSLGERG